MNVLSLPQEMLASMAKYNDNDSLIKIRKMSSTIDKVAKKYRLDRLKVKEISFSIRLKEIEVHYEIANQYGKLLFNVKPSTILVELEFVLKKIRRLHSIWVNDAEINSGFMELLKKYEFLKISKLSFFFCHVFLNSDELKQYLTNINLKEFVFLRSSSNILVNDKFLTGLSLRGLTLLPDGFAFNQSSTITSDGLNEICSRSLPDTFEIEEVDLKWNELKKFLEKNNDKIKIKIRLLNLWRISFVDPEGANVGQIIEYLSKLDCFTDTTVHVTHRLWNSIHIAVSIPYDNEVKYRQQMVFEFKKP